MPFDSDARYSVVEITPVVSESAMRLANLHAFRAYDAVQLAAAIEVQRERERLGFDPVILLSADQALNDAAKAEGLAVDDPRLHP